ncbi:hypothetical protein CEXT_471801 [Caerostris extrusa]|uniref:Uncharacterized protein n=1 Tax=Caerostris extrusa TaxID=172846 RepID=A0AAV4PV02_CAEEX|nr:hypothetical protein CEXT_471801 [Caerostris extrusa]
MYFYISPPKESYHPSKHSVPKCTGLVPDKRPRLLNFSANGALFKTRHVRPDWKLLYQYGDKLDKFVGWNVPSLGLKKIPGKCDPDSVLEIILLNVRLEAAPLFPPSLRHTTTTTTNVRLVAQRQRKCS